jgi:hypothetical protein
MFDFLKGEKTEIVVTLDRPNGIYLPGETAGVTVEIQPDKDLKLKGALVRLSGTEQYKYGSTSSSTDSDGNTTEDTNYYWAYNEFFAREEKFLGETTLPGSKPQRYSFQMSLPADALPSCAGEIVRIYWKFSVKLDRRLAGDLHAETELCVRPLTPSLNLQPGEYGKSDQPNEAELALILPGLETVAGQQLDGQLRILPRKDLGCEVRLELVRNEYVSYGDGNFEHKAFPLKLAGNTKFTAGQQQTIPFQASIPPDAAPSIKTPNGEITWTIKGILARRLRQDITVEQDFSVHLAKT